MYDPKIARFLQEDTYTGSINDPLSLNLYTYCHNEPIMYYDPSGHMWVNRSSSYYAYGKFQTTYYTEWVPDDQYYAKSDIGTMREDAKDSTDLARMYQNKDTIKTKSVTSAILPIEDRNKILKDTPYTPYNSTTSVTKAVFGGDGTIPQAFDDYPLAEIIDELGTTTTAAVTISAVDSFAVQPAILFGYLNDILIMDKNEADRRYGNRVGTWERHVNKIEERIFGNRPEEYYALYTEIKSVTDLLAQAYALTEGIAGIKKIGGSLKSGSIPREYGVDPNTGMKISPVDPSFFPVKPIKIEPSTPKSATPGVSGKVSTGAGGNTANAVNKTRVGQWMSKAEYEQFVKTGEIPRTNVLTKGKEGYIKQANNGDYYVEFDVDSSLLVPKNQELGWSLVKSKNQWYQKLAEKKGTTLPDPIGENIQHITTKQ